MNSLYQQLQMNQQPPQQQSSTLNENSRELFKKMMNTSNPQELVQNLISTNPKMRNIMQMFQASQMTPKQFFYQYAQQKGINPDQFLESLK